MSFPPEPFRCDVNEGPGAAVVALHGELDVSTVGTVHEALEALAEEKRAVLIDLRGLTFMDSSGLRLILETDEHARRDGFDFALVRAPEVVQRLFAITATEDHLTFRDPPQDPTPRA